MNKLLYILIIISFAINLFSQENNKARLIIFENVGQRELVKTSENISIVYGKSIKLEYVYLNYIQGKDSDSYYLELKSVEPILKDLSITNKANDSLKKEIININKIIKDNTDTIFIEKNNLKSSPLYETISTNTLDSLIEANQISENNSIIERMPKVKTLINAVDYVRKQNYNKIERNNGEINEIDIQIDSINSIVNFAEKNDLTSRSIDKYLREIELLKLKKREIQLFNEQLTYSNQILEKELLVRNAEYESLMRLIYIMILIIILILVISLATYYNYYQKKKFNKQLTKINEQLEIINKELHQSNIRNEKLLKLIKDELNQASKYVISLLPKTINNQHVSTEWTFEPSEELGGDSFGYHLIDDENYAFYLIDVSGHGVGAALHSVQVLNILQNSALPNVDFTKPDEVMNALNNIFQMNDYSGLYFTIFYAIYNIKNMNLTYSAAGHPPMLLWQDNKLIDLESQNIFIGASKNINYTSDTIKVKKNDDLFIFSDGVFEIIDEQNKVWTFDDFKSRLANELQTNKISLNNIYNDNLKISGKNILDDDFSFIKVKFF